MAKVRADVLLVETGLAPSRARGQALILAGKVFVGERRVEKGGQLFERDAPIAVRGPDHPFVSRGGVKLAGALSAFGYDPTGKVAADFGASTGGFTDCLLQAGAVKIYSIDVGYGQLDSKLRRDRRVVPMERTNARYVRPSQLGELVDLVVIDASFIGLEKLLPAARGLLRPDGDVIALIKPQFQVGPQDLRRGGVVRDSRARAEAVDRLVQDAGLLGFDPLEQVESVLKGPKGNQETFVWLRVQDRSA